MKKKRQFHIGDLIYNSHIVIYIQDIKNDHLILKFFTFGQLNEFIYDWHDSNPKRIIFQYKINNDNTLSLLKNDLKHIFNCDWRHQLISLNTELDS